MTVESVAFQGMIVMAGYLPSPDTDVAAMGITFALCGQAYVMSAGIAGASDPFIISLSLITRSS